MAFDNVIKILRKQYSETPTRVLAYVFDRVPSPDWNNRVSHPVKWLTISFVDRQGTWSSGKGIDALEKGTWRAA